MLWKYGDSVRVGFFYVNHVTGRIMKAEDVHVMCKILIKKRKPY